MHLIEMIILILQITAVIGRRRLRPGSSSEESVENLLYFKDCSHKKPATAAPTPTALKNIQRVPAEPACPFPKMCCQMTCGNDCNLDSSLNAKSQLFRQNSPMTLPSQPPSRPLQIKPVQPIDERIKRKRLKMLPIEARRNTEFTRDHLKSLIAQDEDIKKILKDLVRVTMQKVDLEEIIEATRNGRNSDVNTENEGEEQTDNEKDYME